MSDLTLSEVRRLLEDDDELTQGLSAIALRRLARPLAETLIEAVVLLRDLTKWVEGCDEAYDEPHAARAFLNRLGE